MNQKQEKGIKGEIEATKYLKRHGYKIICKNFRCMKGEIDIIAYNKENIIFVEVKTRTSTKYGEARETINRDKQKHIYEAARYFMYVNRIEETYARIDAIEVYLQNRKSENQPYRANYVIYTVKTFDF